MSAKITNQNRYKKTTREKSNKTKETKRKELRKDERKLRQTKQVDKITVKQDRITVQKASDTNINTKTINKKTILKVCGILVAIVSVSIMSKVIVNRYNNGSNDVQTTRLDSGKVVSLMQDSVLKIGLSKLDSMDFTSSRNVILNEIYRYTTLSLVSFDTEYNTSYNVAKDIEKTNNKEYIVTLNKDYKVDYNDIKNSVDKIKQAGQNNIYYKAINNIKEIQNVDNDVIKFKLQDDDPYFIYSLNFPIIKENSDKIEYSVGNTIGSEVNLSRKSSESTVKDIILKNYTDIDNMIDDFRNNKIDVFTASSDSIMSLVGKHDYGIKKYRDGSTLFLFGNKDSSLFSRKEVRRAVLYSIDRDKIIRNLNSTFLEKIDLPYLYSSIKYKYDVYGAQNALQAQGWIKSSGIYTKKEGDKEVKIELTLLLNSSDGNKVKVGDYIKEMLEENGIKVNLKQLKDAEFYAALENKEYDIVLANVNLNETPDISFVENYVNINDTTASALNILKNSSAQELSKNLQSLQDVLSEEVACIGIYATNTNLVYQMDIAGFSDISYMNLFSHFKNVGTIQDTN